MQNKSIAFVVSYLLGGTPDYLRDNFKLDYAESDDGSKFEKYLDVNILRHLCILRYSVIRDKSLIDKKEISPLFQESLDYLSMKNINIAKGFHTLSTFDFFNYLSEMIDIIVFKTLVDLDLPCVEVIQPLFHFPTLSESMLNRVVEDFKKLHMDTGIYVYNSERIKHTYSRAFSNDRNLFYSIYSLQNKLFDITIPDFKMYYREESGINIDENIYIDSLKLLDKYYNNNFIVDDKVIGNIVNLEVFDKPIKKAIKELERKIEITDMSAYLQTENLKLFVDCDNIEFFKFFAFLNNLESSNITGVVLLIDEKSSYLWKIFDKIYKGTIPVKSIFVPRLKEHKSVVDVVLTKEVCESVYIDNVENILLVSSDSDFFGLISFLENTNFGVCFVSSAMGAEYLKFLEDKHIPSMDLLTVEDSSIDKIKAIGFSYLLLYELSLVPIKNWTVSSLSDSLYYSLTNETDMKVTKQEIKKFISKNFNDIYIDIIDDEVYICLREYSIKIG